MPTVEQYQAIPRKRHATGALFLEDGKLLVVKPVYKESWSIPGGIVEALESPWAGCLRECREELGLDVTLSHLAVVDWMAEPTPGAHDSLQLIFMGVPLTDAQKKQIVLPPDELAEWAYVPFVEAVARLSPNLAKRVQIALDTMAQGGMAYCENGVNP